MNLEIDISDDLEYDMTVSKDEDNNYKIHIQATSETYILPYDLKLILDEDQVEELFSKIKKLK
ncbi:MAG: hypothetical protein ACTSP9_07980 [Promethearchaeota archaeon]